MDASETPACGKTYYAQTEKPAVQRTITFDPNGNKSFTYARTKKTSTTTYNLCKISATYNGEQQLSSCTKQVTFPEIEPAEGKTEI